MNAKTTMAMLRSYAPPGGRAALTTRLQRMAAAGHDESCATYFDLRPPSPRAPLHARTTYLLADLFVNGGTKLPLPMDTVVPSWWRLLVAAGFGRLQDVGLTLAPSAAAAPDSLLHRVCTGIAGSDELSDDLFRHAAQILWRLGTKQSILDLYRIEPEANPITAVRMSDHPSDIASTFFIQHGTSDAFEEAALARAADPTLAIPERVRLIRFVLVRRGKERRPAGDRLSRAYVVGAPILRDLSGDNEFRSALLRSTLHRAMAFHPFLAGQAETALEHLCQADVLLTAQRPDDAALQLLLWDHHFPALETLSQTAGMLGRHEQAADAAHRLVALDPYDARSWFALGKVMIGQGDLLSAASAFAAAASCEFAQQARACFFAAVAYAEAGQKDTARYWLHRSAALDPTPPVLESLGRTW
ncbi:tetratricopeptide repeat protein [Rhizohabitans arisaemae]|uniref:tetratricopeptide repeat protein n=1 Tax=Rhizohabitans arisaemae TaxID=2720610 RepID=UPI0024B15657|nr:hypothetical protein [Rhizohabitans arisaemae]